MQLIAPSQVSVAAYNASEFKIPTATEIYYFIRPERPSELIVSDLDWKTVRDVDEKDVFGNKVIPEGEHYPSEICTDT